MARDIPPAEWREQRWKNGRGITHEIIRWPAGAADDRYDVRVSFVELTEPGPFSTFAGHDRWIILLEKSQLVLHAHDTTYTMHSPGAFKLDGATAVTAELPGGPTRLVNVIARANTVAVGTNHSFAKVRFVFALDEPNALHLPRWHARVLEPREMVSGSLAWLYWLDWREDPHQPPRAAGAASRATKREPGPSAKPKSKRR